jgi:hypothetical protein
MNRKIDIIWLIIGLIIIFALLKQCEEEPQVITKTETVTKIVTDTITQVKIKEVPKTVYVEKIKTKTIKGDSIIVYKDKPGETSTMATLYQTELLSNEAKADLQIVVDGELLDISGTIQFPKEEKTTTIIKKTNNSGLFIYGQLPISTSIAPELGVMFQIKNKIIIGAGANYNNFTKKIEPNITLGIKL